jgi:hypothetical protein
MSVSIVNFMVIQTLALIVRRWPVHRAAKSKGGGTERIDIR